MAVLKTTINPRSEAYQSNVEAMGALESDLKEKVGKAALGGDERSRDRHLGRGKLLPRDRVNYLLHVATYSDLHHNPRKQHVGDF